MRSKNTILEKRNICWSKNSQISITSAGSLTLDSLYLKNSKSYSHHKVYQRYQIMKRNIDGLLFYYIVEIQKNSN